MEQEKKTYTCREVLEITIRNLEGIMLPVAVVDTVGMTIKNSVKNLQACVESMAREEAKAREAEQPAAEQEPAADEPEIIILGDDEPGGV